MLGSESGNDQRARQDMFPTQVEMWKTEKRLGSKPVGSADSFSETFSNPVAQHLIALAKLRQQHPALANAQMQVRYAKGSVFAFSKRDLNSKREYLVVLNNGAKAQKVTIPTASKGAWKVLSGKASFSSKAAAITLTLGGLESVVLRAEKEITAQSINVGTIATKEDFLTGFYRITAGVQTADLATAEFFIRNVGGKDWISLGVDLNSPYRVYVDPREHSGKVEVTAVITSSLGRKYELPSTALNIATP
jgi:hypothetical protein